MNVLYHASQVKTYINMSYMQERQQKSDFFFFFENSLTEAFFPFQFNSASLLEMIDRCHWIMVIVIRVYISLKVMNF